VDEGVCGAYQVLIGVGVERVAGDDFGAPGEIAFRSRAHQSADVVAALEEHGDQAATEVASSSRDKDAAWMGAPGKLLDLQQETDVRN
jgi:hypothetical protein